VFRIRLEDSSFPHAITSAVMVRFDPFRLQKQGDAAKETHVRPSLNFPDTPNPVNRAYAYLLSLTNWTL
jgi:hypothetical protein